MDQQKADVKSQENQPLSQEDAHVQSQQVPGPPKRGNTKRKKILTLLAGLFISAAIGGAGYLLGARQDPKTTNSVQTIKTPELEQKVTTEMTAKDPQLERFITPTTGESWLTEPKAIAGQGWYTSEYKETGLMKLFRVLSSKKRICHFTSPS